MPLTFDLCHTLTLAPSLSVNDFENQGAIEGSVHLERNLSACEGLVIVCRWCFSTHAGSGSCHIVLKAHFDVLVAMFVPAVSQIFIENRCP